MKKNMTSIWDFTDIAALEEAWGKKEGQLKADLKKSIFKNNSRDTGSGIGKKSWKWSLVTSFKNHCIGAERIYLAWVTTSSQMLPHWL